MLLQIFGPRISKLLLPPNLKTLVTARISDVAITWSYYGHQCGVTSPGPLGRSPAVSLTSGTCGLSVCAPGLRDVVDSTLSAVHPVTLSDPYDGLTAERALSIVERACAKSRGYARCLSDELHPPRRRLCKDGATSAIRDRFPDRADITPLERRCGGGGASSL